MFLSISDFPTLFALGATQADLNRLVFELEYRRLGKLPFRFSVEVGTYPTVGELVAAVEAHYCPKS